MSTLFNIGNKIATTTEALLPVQEATAGYSLRNISIKEYNQPVVRVVRERDSAEEDFTASEVSDGTLVDWVNNVTTETFQPGDNALGDFSTLNINYMTISYPANNSNGHDGKVIKATRNNVDGGQAAGLQILTNEPIIGQKIKVSFLYRSDIIFALSNGASSPYTNIQANDTSTAVRFEEEIDWNPTAGNDSRIIFAYVKNNGEYIEISDLSVEYLTSNGLVKVWYDQFGDNNATQNTVSAMPKIVDVGTLVTENGKPAVEFNGTTHSLSLPDAVLPSNLNNVSVFTVQVMGSSSPSTNGIGLVLGDEVSDSRFYLLFQNNFGYGNDADIIPNVSVSANTQHLISAIAGSTQGNAQPFVDGLSQGTTALQNVVPESGAGFISRDASNLYFSGHFQEVIIYHSDQSTNREAIENNINSYYNIYS